MRRVLLLLLASLFLMAMKCGPAPCQVGKGVSRGHLLTWFGVNDAEFSEIDSMHVLISRNGNVIQSRGFHMPLDELPTLWEVESSDDSITLPAQVEIGFYGSAIRRDSLTLILRERQYLNLYCNRGNGLDEWMVDSLSDSECSTYVCWIDDGSKAEDPCAD